MSEDSPAPEHEHEHEPNSRPRRSGSVIKILCPYYVAGAVIGKGGENIKEIKERSDAAVVVSQNNVRFPGTNERVISIRGSIDAIKICVNMIQEKIRTDQPPENVKGPRTENEKRKQCCKLVVSDNTLGRIIGKAGKTVQEMKSKHNVEINTTRRSETPFGLDERAISIEGEEECVDECTEEIIKIVCEDTYASMRFVTDYDMFFMDRRGPAFYGGYNMGRGRGGYNGGGGGGGGMRGGYGGGYGGPRGGGYEMYPPFMRGGYRGGRGRGNYNNYRDNNNGRRDDRREERGPRRDSRS